MKIQWKKERRLEEKKKRRKEIEKSLRKKFLYYSIAENRKCPLSLSLSHEEDSSANGVAAAHLADEYDARQLSGD